MEIASEKELNDVVAGGMSGVGKRSARVVAGSSPAPVSEWFLFEDKYG